MIITNLPRREVIGKSTPNYYHSKTEKSNLFTLLEGKTNIFIAGDFNARCRDYGDIFNAVRVSTLKALFNGLIFRCFFGGSATFKFLLLLKRHTILHGRWKTLQLEVVIITQYDYELNTI